TVASLVSSPNPSTIGQSVTLTATVAAAAPGAGAQAGSVQFFDGATSLGSATLPTNSVTATFTTPGLHLLTVVFTSSSGNFTGSTSAVLNHFVGVANSSTALAAAPASPQTYGTAVTFTATVTAVGPATGTPTGTVLFVDGAT